MPQTAVISELVTEEIRWLRQQLSGQTAPLPRFIGVRLGDYAVDLLNYDLRGLIDAIAPQAWQSATDTPAVLENLHQILTLEQDELASQWPIQPSANVLPNTADVSIEVSKQPPLPIAAPELPGGQMDLTSAFYVERPPVEMRCYEMLDQPGSLIRIKAPRQMGKTSLLARILHQAAEREHRAVSLSFQIADASVFSDLKQFLKWFCACLSRKLQLPNRVNEVWDDILGAKMNCSTYFEDCLLPEIGGTLTLGLDELDCVFAYSDVVKDFLGLLRTWNEDARTGGIWRKLQLVLVHSTEVYIPLDISQSPFNVGLPIELKDFNVEQILDLAYRHHLAWRDTEAQRLMAMIGGHPFLSRLSLYHLARRDITLDELQKGSATEAGLYGDHLRRQLWTLQQYPDLADAMRAVVASQSPVRLEPVQAFKLSGMGLVLLDNNEVYPRYELYRQYFSDRLS
ncbi:MAG: AAA-like domain-containing protein [Thainema sp.]